MEKFISIKEITNKEIIKNYQKKFGYKFRNLIILMNKVYWISKGSSSLIVKIYWKFITCLVVKRKHLKINLK